MIPYRRNTYILAVVTSVALAVSAFALLRDTPASPLPIEMPPVMVTLTGSVDSPGQSIRISSYGPTAQRDGTPVDFTPWKDTRVEPPLPSVCDLSLAEGGECRLASPGGDRLFIHIPGQISVERCRRLGTRLRVQTERGPSVRIHANDATVDRVDCKFPIVYVD